MVVSVCPCTQHTLEWPVLGSRDLFKNNLGTEAICMFKSKIHNRHNGPDRKLFTSKEDRERKDTKNDQAPWPYESSLRWETSKERV